MIDLHTKEKQVFVEDGIYRFMTKYNFLNLDIGYFNRWSYIVLEFFKIENLYLNIL